MQSELRPSTTRKARRWNASLGATLLVLLALVAAQAGSRSAGAATSALSSISGTVTLAGAPVADAEVATTMYGLPRKDATDASGSYSITGLIAGTYGLSVRPAAITTTSPAWVYTGGDLLVNVPPSATQNITVTAATITVNGTLALPAGASGDFATAGQRAWVRAENQEGQGNTVQVQANGSFSIKVLPGAILLSVTLEEDDWAAPTTLRGSVYYAEPGQTEPVLVDGDPATPAADPIQIVRAQASISGTVKVLGGGPVQNTPIPVYAWRLDGSEFEQTVTDLSGLYSMKVISGTWMIRAVPLEGQGYVAAEPPQKVVLASDTATASKDLLVATADVTINGQLVDSATGAPVAANGRAYALYREGNQPRFGPTAGISGETGAFTLRLASSVAMSYTIGVYFPPDVPYTALDRSLQLNVTLGETRAVTIPVAVDNSLISGVLRDRNGAVVKGVPGAVWGVSDNGGWARTRVNPQDGTYALSVVTTDLRGKGGSSWRVRAFVDPTTGWFVQRPRVQRLFLPYNNGQGTDLPDRDFTVVNISSLRPITGRVTRPGPNGTIVPVARARVAAQEVAANSSAAFASWAYTDADGNYTLPVPPGSYKVSVHERRLNLGASSILFVEPAPALAVVTADSAPVVNLSFRQTNAIVTGQVSYQSSGKRALLRARAADGATINAHTGANGNYALALLAGQEWTIEAVAADGNTFLRSAKVTITPSVSPPANSGVNLTLEPAAVLPESVAFTVPPQGDQIFTLADGSQVQVPGGALTTAGNAVLTARPLPELESVGDAQPIAFGYRLHAFDAAGRPITRFLQPVTLVVPFTAAQLQAAGVTAEQLVPSYWDEETGSWKPVENVSVLVDDNGGGTVNITVEHFTDYAVLGGSGGALYLPLVVR